MYKAFAKAKEKRDKKGLSVNLLPHAQRPFQALLGFNAHQPKLLLEIDLPFYEVAALIVKDDTISSCPNNPTSSDDNFSENRSVKGCSGLDRGNSTHLEQWRRLV